METQMFTSAQWEGMSWELLLMVHPRRKQDARSSAWAFLVLGRLLEARRPASSVEFTPIRFLIFLALIPRRCGLG